MIKMMRTGWESVEGEDKKINVTSIRRMVNLEVKWPHGQVRRQKWVKTCNNKGDSQSNIGTQIIN